MLPAFDWQWSRNAKPPQMVWRQLASIEALRNAPLRLSPLLRPQRYNFGKPFDALSFDPPLAAAHLKAQHLNGRHGRLGAFVAEFAPGAVLGLLQGIGCHDPKNDGLVKF